MAEYTSLVEAGEALVKLLRQELTPEPVADKELISLGSPFEAENNQLTLYLFQVEEDLQSGYSGYMQESVDTARIQPARFQLSYLITAHSKAPVHLKDADQQRIIGKVIQTIKDYPHIPQEFYGGSLSGTNTQLLLSMERPNFEQLMKIWNNNTVPYKLSIVAKISGVTIDSKRTKHIRRVTDVQIDTEQIVK